ncbi:MAG: pyridoxal 5'-phosphate synthase glutaminase subunit PdxT [Patescibacteria group bacterium]
MIGVLALQGAFIEHIKILDKLKVKNLEVRTKNDLDKINGLIIPGGESSTNGYLLKQTGLDKEIKKRANKDLAIWGVCTGLILLAKEVDNEFSLKLMDIKVKRNIYGSNINSFEDKITSTKFKDFHGIFIRAPRILKTSPEVEILARYLPAGKAGKKDPVMVKQGMLLGCSFHPELTTDTRIHKYFISTFDLVK